MSRYCDLGDPNERAVVLSIDDNGRTLVLVFANRDQGRRVVRTGTDYLYLRRV